MARLRFALLLVFLTALAGTTGYMVIERWGLLDAVYMTVITLATVGYSETHPLSDTGRVFTMVLIFVGRIVEIYLVVNFTQVLVVEQLKGTFQRRRMQQEIQRLRGHYLICGWGRMGQEIVDQFHARKIPHVVIELSSEKCAVLRERKVLVVQGDAADDRVLKEAGIEHAAGLIAVAPGDADNVFITLSARALNPDLFIVARCAYEQDIQKLRTAGANRVISPYVIGAHRIAAAAFHPIVVDFLDQQFGQEQLEWEIEEIEIRPNTPFAGRTLRESGIRDQTGCTVLAVRDALEKRFRNNPSPDSILAVGDTLIVLGAPDQLQRLNQMSATTG